MSRGSFLIATGIRFSLRLNRRVSPVTKVIIPVSSGKPGLGRTAGLKRFIAWSARPRKNRKRGGVLLVEVGITHRQPATTDAGDVCRGGSGHYHTKFPLLRGFD